MLDYLKSFSFQRKFTLSFVFFVLIVLSRIFVETTVMAKRMYLGYYVVFHHFNWYLFVLFYYLLCARYILRMRNSAMACLPLGAVLVYIPMLYGLFAGTKMQLEYLSGSSFSQILYHMATLMYFHPENHPFFLELLVLMGLFAGASYTFSKSVWRTAQSHVRFLWEYDCCRGTSFRSGSRYEGVYKDTDAFQESSADGSNLLLSSLWNNVDYASSRNKKDY